MYTHVCLRVRVPACTGRRHGPHRPHLRVLPPPSPPSSHTPHPPTLTGCPWLLRPSTLDLYISPGAVAEIIAELRTLPMHHLRRQQEKGQQVRGCVWVGG